MRDSVKITLMTINDVLMPIGLIISKLPVVQC